MYMKRSNDVETFTRIALQLCEILSYYFDIITMLYVVANVYRYASVRINSFNGWVGYVSCCITTIIPNVIWWMCSYVNRDGRRTA